METLIQTKIQKKIGGIVNDYSRIEEDYENKFHEPLNKKPFLSISEFPLKECKYKVSIIISSWNSGKTLMYTLKTIENTYICQNFNDKLEIVIVDDGSNDATEEQIKLNNFNFKYKYIKQVHLGRAQGINMGVLKSSGDILLICDADILFFPFTIDELIKRQQEYLNKAIFFGFREDVKIHRKLTKMKVGDIDDYIRTKKPCFWLDNRFRTDFSAGWGDNMMLETDMLQNLTLDKNIWVSDNRTSMYDSWQLYRMVYGFLFTVSRKIFESVGGFCELLVGWGCDDTSFIAQCLEKEIRIIPVPSAHCLHIHHPIRMSTQWEDGRKNERRMNDYLSQDIKRDFLNQDFNKRILTEFQSTVLVENIKSPMNYEIPRLSRMELARINYKVGNLKDSLSLYNENKNEFESEDFENYFDLLIRLKDQDLFERYYKEDSKYKKYYYYNLAKYYFKDEITLEDFKKALEGSKYMRYLFTIEKEDHKRRAEQYYFQKQWYLSLRDYYAAFVLGDEECKEKCDYCVEQLKKDE